MDAAVLPAKKTAGKTADPGVRDKKPNPQQWLERKFSDIVQYVVPTQNCHLSTCHQEQLLMTENSFRFQLMAE